jgi:hypothetical protein
MCFCCECIRLFDECRAGDADFLGAGGDSDDEDDGVPEAGAPRTEEEKAAAKRAAQLAATGLSEEELGRFTAMFETVSSPDTE